MAAQPFGPLGSPHPSFKDSLNGAPPCARLKWGRIPPDQWPADLHPALREVGLESAPHRLVPIKSLSFATTAAVARAYIEIQQVSGHVGGEAHGGAIYGEMSRANMQRLIELMRLVTGLNEDCVFVDIGSGLGKPSIHAAAAVGCLSLGVEYMATRFNLSIANLKRLSREAGPRGAAGPLRSLGAPRAMFCCEDALALGNLEPVTHLFMFDVGMPHRVMSHVATIFAASNTTDFLVCFRPPEEARRLGFRVSLLASTTAKLTGSGEAHRAFFYARKDRAPGSGVAAARTLVRAVKAAGPKGLRPGLTVFEQVPQETAPSGGGATGSAGGTGPPEAAADATEEEEEGAVDEAAEWRSMLGGASARSELRSAQLARIGSGHEEAHVAEGRVCEGPPRCFRDMLEQLSGGWAGYTAALDHHMASWTVDRLSASARTPAGPDVGPGGGPRRVISLRRRSKADLRRLRAMAQDRTHEAIGRAREAQAAAEARARDDDEEQQAGEAAAVAAAILAGDIATGTALHVQLAASDPTFDGAPVRWGLRRLVGPLAPKRGRPPGPDPADCVGPCAPSAFSDRMWRLRRRAADASEPAVAASLELALGTLTSLPAVQRRRLVALHRLLWPAGYHIGMFRCQNVRRPPKVGLRGLEGVTARRAVLASIRAEPWADGEPAAVAAATATGRAAKRLRTELALHRTPTPELTVAVDVLLSASTRASPSERLAAFRVVQRAAEQYAPAAAPGSAGAGQHASSTLDEDGVDMAEDVPWDGTPALPSPRPVRPAAAGVACSAGTKGAAGSSGDGSAVLSWALGDGALAHSELWSCAEQRWGASSPADEADDRSTPDAAEASEEEATARPVTLELSLGDA